MADVVQTFTTDDSKAIAAYQRLQRENVKLQEQLKNTTRESKKGSDTAIDGFEGQLKSLVSIGAAVAVVSKAYTEWSAEIRKAGAESEKLMTSLVKGLSDTGQLLQGGKIEKLVSSIASGSTATREQAMAAIFGAQRGAPGIDAGKLQAIAGRAAGFAPALGGGAGDVGELAEAAARLGTVFGGKSTDDIFDLVSAFKGEKVGKGIGDLTDATFLRGTQLVAGTGAISEERALALGLASQQQNLGPKFMTTLAGLLGDTDPKNIKEAAHGKDLSAADLASNRFYGADAQSRFAMLMGGDAAAADSVLGAVDAQKLRAIAKAGSLPGIEQRLREAQSTNLAQRELAGLGGFEAGRDSRQKQIIAAQADRAAPNIEGIGRDRQDLAETLEVALNDTNAGPLKRFLARRLIDVGQAAAGLTGDETLGRAALNAYASPTSLAPGADEIRDVLIRINQLQQEQVNIMRERGNVPATNAGLNSQIE